MSLLLNGTDGVTFNDGSEQWAAASPIGTKNLIINGNMQIAQRGTSATGKTTSGYYTCDRWYNVFSGAGTWTFTQDTDVPSGQGFVNSLKLDCTTANASLSAADSFQLHQRLEGQMLQHLKKGSSNAESVTLSFWVKSNKTGTYQFNLRDIDNTRMIAKTYTINTADTWENKTLTFAGDTTGVFDNDNNNSLRLEWWFASGSNYNTGSVPTSWESTDTTDLAAGLTVNLADSTSNYINITGVQLEVGDTATPFEHRPYDMELQRCMRYFQTMTFAAGYVDVAHAILTTAARGPMFQMSPSMRAAPTITLPTAGTGSGQLHYTNGAGQVPSGVGTNAPQGIQVNSFRIEGDSYSGLNANQPSLLRIGSGGSGTFTMSAEL